MTHDSPCPKAADWRRYLQGTYPELVEHAAACSRCAPVLQTLMTPDEAPAESAPPATPPRRARLSVTLGSLGLFVGVVATAYLSFAFRDPPPSEAKGKEKQGKSRPVLEMKSDEPRPADPPKTDVMIPAGSPAGLVTGATVPPPPILPVATLLLPEKEETGVKLAGGVSPTPPTESPPLTASQVSDVSAPPLPVAAALPPAAEVSGRSFDKPLPPVPSAISAEPLLLMPPPLLVGKAEPPPSLPAAEALPPPKSEPLPPVPAAPVLVLGDERLRHWEELHCVAYRPDGKVLAGGGGSRGEAVIRLWDAETYRQRAVLRTDADAEEGQFQGVVVSLTFAPDGNRLAARCDNGTVCLWNLNDDEGKLWAKLPGDARGATAFSGDGKTLAVGRGKDRVQLWDLSGRLPNVGDVHKGLPGADGGVAYAPDGKTVRADDGRAAAKKFPTRGPSTVRPDGRFVASVCAEEKRIRVVPSDRLTREEIPLVGHAQGVRFAAFLPDGDEILTVGEGGGGVVWDLKGKRLTADGDAWPDRARGRPLFARDSSIVAFVDDTSLLVRDRAAPRRDGVTVPRGGEKGGVAVTDLGDLIAVGNADGTIHLWAAGWAEPKRRATLKQHGAAVARLGFSEDGKTLVSCDEAGLVCVWNVANGELRTKHDTSRVPGSPFRLGVSDGGDVVTVVKRTGASLASWKGDSPRKTFGPGPTCRLQDLDDGFDAGAAEVSPDGQRIAVREKRDVVTVWDTATGRKLVTWKFQGPVHGVAFSAGGRQVLTANANGTAYLLRLDASAGAAVTLGSR